MNLAAFYSRLLPDTGRYVLFQNKQHTFCDTLDELVAATQARINTQGLYYATASYGSEDRRTQDNALLLKTHRLDIDAGAEKFAKHPQDAYETQRDALTALGRFIKASGLQPSLVVSSGEGLHVYYELSEPVPGHEWKPVALRLNAAGKALGLKIDAGCTADEARVLRPIGTLHKNGQHVALLKDFGVTYTNAEFDALLKPLIPANEFPITLTRKPKGAASINDDILAMNSPPASLAKVADRCSAVALMRDKGGNVPEPLWRAVIGVGKYTDDGEELVHKWSAGYDGYSAQETQDKFDRWETPPSTCAHISTLHGGCSTCKYRSKITTPKQVGHVSAPAPEETDDKPKGEVPREVMAADLKVALRDWRQDSKGSLIRPLDTTGNVQGLADAHGVDIRHNVMARRTEIIIPGLASGRDDIENAALAVLGDMAVKAGMNRRGLKELVDAVAGSRPYHPALEWIHSKAWDRRSRMDQFHATLEVASDYPETLRDKLLDAFCLSAIHALVSVDGLAAQGMLVLSGNQGINKTRWVESICPVPGAVRTGFSLNPFDKDSIFQATTAWFTELGELDATVRRADVSALKAFITRFEDVLRRPYALTDNVYRRRTCFIGTVNGSGFLADDTGDRRFWVVKIVHAHLLPADELQQIWAEYLSRYERGERWYLCADTQSALANTNREHRVVDPVQEKILGAFDWGKTSETDWFKRPSTLWASATEVCIRVGIPQPKRADSTRAAGVVRALNGGIARRSNGLTLLALPPPMRGGL
ncbi:VapE domain-containing protein [Polaromonas sp.]|uniref:VapE domain-containing protein n=1 Tax=Polaromonas sp. TaxID=1869339 RepID=UPI002B7DDC0B|nr:VapE domain-containing protein [Polaromonas sp.]HQS32743.1 VapE family protein [Polaromonas sp.]HQS91926.1 VapE family protein [Polaromonas sp.]